MVVTTFSNSPLEEEVYVDQPPSFEVTGQEDKVYKLKKSLYKIKQAPREWNIKICCFFCTWISISCTIKYGIYVIVIISDFISFVSM